MAQISEKTSDAISPPVADSWNERVATLLLVDDEANILSSLRRLFRPHGYKILAAEGGREGLEILAVHEVDLIISDMRMPEMDGATFLARTAEQWPDTIRILLTGYADMSATIAAINEGKIYKYFSKPWEENDILLSVRHALEQRFLEQERRRLLALTQKQNAQLHDLNTSLEEKVRQRTEELRQAMGMLETAHESLKKNYVNTIKVFSNIIEMREGALAGHSRRVAELARRLAQHVGMSDEEVQQVLFASLLHDIGKIGMPDKLIGQPFNALPGEERAQLVKHPLIGEGILLALDYLKDAAQLIRSHHERYDGQGYPHGLCGKDIPLGARIIALVNDYDALQIGTLASQRLSAVEAREFIARHGGTRYDPRLVAEFLKLMGSGQVKAPEPQGRQVRSNGLRVGMVLARDLVMKNKVLLLSKGHVLDNHMIQRVQGLERATGEELVFYIA